MELILLILLIVLCAATALGVLVGLFRKATRTSFWGVVALLGALIARLITQFVKRGDKNYAIVVLAGTAASLLVLMAIFAALRAFLTHGSKAHKEYSHYKNHDAAEENEAYVLNAVDNGDKGEYKKQRRAGKDIKDTTGAWGFWDRLLGAIACGVNAFVAAAVIIGIVVLFVDFAPISFLDEAFEPVLTSNVWTKFACNFALDLPLTLAITLGIKGGYKNGIFSVVYFVIIVAMLVGFGYVAWLIASSSACEGAVSGLQNGLLSWFADKLSESVLKTVATITLAVFIYLLSLIVVILTAILLPKLFEVFKEGKLVSVVDGALGAVFMCAVVAALLMLGGGVAYTLNDLEFMERFNKYAQCSCFADAMYTYNPLADWFAKLPIRSWFKAAESTT